MTNEIKIEKGIPIPGMGATGLTALLRRLEVVDSALVDNRATSIIITAAKIGIKVVTRKAENGQRRVWRTA